MSRLSASRTSPTTSRSGRMRRASLTNRRSGISPSPSRFGCRHWRPTTSRRGNCSSKISSTVITRSRLPMLAARQFSIVVLPAWVAPETRMLRPLDTAAPRKRADCGVSVPSSTRCSRRLAFTTNFLMFTAQCLRVTSGMTTCSLEPSGSAASTKGDDMSRRRPELLSILSTRSRTCCSVRLREVSSDSPLRATKISLGALSQISSIEGSSSRGCSTPKPATASKRNRRAASSGPMGGRGPMSARSS